ncbi:MAG: hypothetical protein ACK41T_08260 [Pseudobdellovibrio sp.]
MITIRNDFKNIQIKSLAGTFWLTPQNDIEDYIISEQPQSLALQQGKLIIEALSSKVKIDLNPN